MKAKTTLILGGLAILAGSAVAFFNKLRNFNANLTIKIGTFDVDFTGIFRGEIKMNAIIINGTKKHSGYGAFDLD